MPHDDILTFGSENISGSARGLTREERRRHIFAIGSTGVGKSTLMSNLIYQDFENGDGCTVIDPHGDTVRDLARSLPKHRIEDCVFFDTADRDYPLGFNPLDRVPERYHSLVISTLMSCFESQWEHSYGPRMAYILRYCLSTLIVQPPQRGVTLLSISRLLTDRRYRNSLLERVRDPVTLAFWKNEYERFPEREIAMVISPILNKIGAYGQHRELRNIIGQPRSSFDLFTMMERQDILLVNLSKATLGEDGASLLGSLLVSGLQQAAYRRDDQAEEERTDHFLYIDEAHFIRSDRTLASILSEARKFRLSAYLASQWCSQSSDFLSDAIFGNCGTLCAFSVSAKDAVTLAPYFSPLPPSELSVSGRGEFMFASRKGGEVEHPQRLKAERRACTRNRLQKVRSWTRATAARHRKREEVERKIMRALAPKQLAGL